MKSYASFAEWKKDQSAKNKLLIGALERVVDATAPQLEKTVKWGQGCWASESGPKTYIHAGSDNVQLGFYRGSALDDPKGVLSGKGKYVRFIVVRSPSDINEAAMKKLIRQAIRES